MLGVRLTARTRHLPPKTYPPHENTRESTRAQRNIERLLENTRITRYSTSEIGLHPHRPVHMITHTQPTMTQFRENTPRLMLHPAPKILVPLPTLTLPHRGAPPHTQRTISQPPAHTHRIALRSLPEVCLPHQSIQEPPHTQTTMQRLPEYTPRIVQQPALKIHCPQPMSLQPNRSVQELAHIQQATSRL
jgi:hypothetical protein